MCGGGCVWLSGVRRRGERERESGRGRGKGNGGQTKVNSQGGDGRSMTPLRKVDARRYISVWANKHTTQHNNTTQHTQHNTTQHNNTTIQHNTILHTPLHSTQLNTTQHMAYTQTNIPTYKHQHQPHTTQLRTCPAKASLNSAAASSSTATPCSTNWFCKCSAAAL